MRVRHWVVVIGVVAAAVTSCWVAMPGRVKPAGDALNLELPDLDGDGKAEHFRVSVTGSGRTLVRLDATRGKFTHDMLEMPPVGALSVKGDRPRWHVTDALGKEVIDMRLIEHGVAGETPELVVFAGGKGKRYRYVDRGFLKLDANTVIPGYSVGLVQIGDDAVTLGVLGDRAVTQGAWKPVAPQGARFELKADEHARVASVVYDSQALVATNGVKPGVDEAELARHFPGRREGDHWVSARYGFRAILDGRGRAFVMELARPWRDGPGEGPRNGVSGN